ncbi:MAG: thioredoxin family protein [Bacteroidetes bacterium]|nr:MAG: thioredoxin family protein [Bacteroidota bacterium]
MRKFILPVFFFATVSLSAQTGTIITGKVNDSKGDTLKFYWPSDFVVNSELSQTVIVDGKGRFTVLVPVERPMYMGVYSGRESSVFYIGPGDSLKMEFTSRKPDKTIKFSGKYAADNNFLREYMETFKSFRQENAQHQQKDSAKVYRAYRDTLMKKQQRMISARKKELSPGFVQLIRSDMMYSACLDKIGYVKSSRMYSIRPGEEESKLPGHYDFMYSYGIINDSATVSGYYSRFIDLYLRHQYLRTVNFSKTGKNLTAAELFAFAKLVLTGKTLDEAIANLLKYALTTEEVEPAGQMLDWLKTHGYSKPAVNSLEGEYKRILAFGPGAPAPDFTLKDENGKEVSLSSLKGKAVYLDFWASWCGPCKKEMPNSVALKKKLEGRNVTFVYVSIDKDENAWRSSMKQINVEGIHLCTGAAKNELIGKLYNIQFIPRYVIIDKEGKIVDAHAPRPSDRQTEQVLMELSK